MVEIGPMILEKKIFKKGFFKVFSLFRNYLPMAKGGAIHLNKLESSSPNDALFEISSVVLKKKIF